MIGYPCPVCRRAGGAVTVQIEGAPLRQYCSEHCARLHMIRPSLAPNEEAAVREGGAAAGSYLESIGKTDLARLTEAEWRAFCATLFGATCEAMRKAADDEIPF